MAYDTVKLNYGTGVHRVLEGHACYTCKNAQYITNNTHTTVCISEMEKDDQRPMRTPAIYF